MKDNVAFWKMIGTIPAVLKISTTINGVSGRTNITDNMWYK